jgi:hypothetical protein
VARLSVGVRGASPLLDRKVVELVASTRAGAAMRLPHRKALLRRLAAERVPAAIAWQPKAEPLTDWLVQRWIANPDKVARTLALVKSSPLLAESVDPTILAAAAHAARTLPATESLATSIVQLAGVAEWIVTIEKQLLAG